MSEQILEATMPMLAELIMMLLNTEGTANWTKLPVRARERDANPDDDIFVIDVQCDHRGVIIIVGPEE